MPVHSLFITNGSGNILFSKFFAVLSSADETVFQHALFHNCTFYWSKDITNSKHALNIKNVYTVFQKFGDFIVIISGSDDVDEPICKSWPRPLRFC